MWPQDTLWRWADRLADRLVMRGKKERNIKTVIYDFVLSTWLPSPFSISIPSFYNPHPKNFWSPWDFNQKTSSPGHWTGFVSRVSSQWMCPSSPSACAHALLKPVRSLRAPMPRRLHSWLECAYTLGSKKCREGGPIQIIHSTEQMNQPKLACELGPLIRESVEIYPTGECQPTMHSK